MINALLYDEILHYILEDSNMFVRSLGAITESFFAYASFEPYYLTYETAVAFYSEHHKVPTRKELLTLVKSKIDNEKLYSNQFKDIDIKLFFDKIYESIYTPEYLEETFFKNYERGEILRILEKYTTEMDSKNLLDFHKEVEAAHLVSLKMSGNQCQENYATEISRTTHIYHDSAMENLYSVIPTGFDILDGYLNGGLHKKQLGVMLAPPNKGKTAIMLNMAYNAAAMGYKVLFLEGEMTRDELHDRLNCYASGLKHYELASKHAKEFRDFTIPIRRTGGALYIEEFDMEGMTISDFKERVKRYKDLHGIDAVFVDYFDIMGKEESEEQLRLQLKKIYTAGKKLAREYNLAIWTASQTNRSGVNNPLVTEYNIGEDFSKVATADKIMSLNSTIEEYNENKSRIFIIKNRGGQKYKMIELLTDFEIMQLVEHFEIDYASFMADYDITDRGNMVRKKAAKKTATPTGTESATSQPECQNSDFKELYGNH